MSTDSPFTYGLCVWYKESYLTSAPHTFLCILVIVGSYHVLQSLRADFVCAQCWNHLAAFSHVNFCLSRLHRVFSLWLHTILHSQHMWWFCFLPLKNIYFYFLGMNIYLHVDTHGPVPMKDRRGYRVPGTGLTDGCEPSRGCWKPDPGPAFKNKKCF